MEGTPNTEEIEKRLDEQEKRIEALEQRCNEFEFRGSPSADYKDHSSSDS